MELTPEQLREAENKGANLAPVDLARIAYNIKNMNFFCRHCGLHQFDNLLHECKHCGSPIEPRFDVDGKPVKYGKTLEESK